MKYLSLSAAAFLGAILICGNAFAVQDQPAMSNGIQLPQDYKKWRLIGVSHRNDNQSLRAIIGLHGLGNQFQSLYHFTVGMPKEDQRLQLGSARPGTSE